MRSFIGRSAGYALTFWERLARHGDYPETVTAWSSLLTHPVPLSGPFDWGLAIGTYRRSGARARSRTDLGTLLDLHRDEEDQEAGECLARLLSGVVERLCREHNFDSLLPVPHSFASRGHTGIASLLTWPGLSWPLPVYRETLAWKVARAPRPDCRGPAGGAQHDAPLTVTRDVEGERLLVVDDLWRSGNTATQVVHTLRAGKAASVGLLVICYDGEDAHDS